MQTRSVAYPSSYSVGGGGEGGGGEGGGGEGGRWRATMTTSIIIIFVCIFKV